VFEGDNLVDHHCAWLDIIKENVDIDEMIGELQGFKDTAVANCEAKLKLPTCFACGCHVEGLSGRGYCGSCHSKLYAGLR
jgi:hypothetical protein